MLGNCLGRMRMEVGYKVFTSTPTTFFVWGDDDKKNPTVSLPFISMLNISLTLNTTCRAPTGKRARIRKKLGKINNLPSTTRLAYAKITKSKKSQKITKNQKREPSRNQSWKVEKTAKQQRKNKGKTKGKTISTPHATACRYIGPPPAPLPHPGGGALPINPLVRFGGKGICDGRGGNGGCPFENWAGGGGGGGPCIPIGVWGKCIGGGGGG